MSIDVSKYEKTEDGFKAFNQNDEEVGQVKIRQVDGHIAIDDIGVKKEYRRQGIASNLTDLVINEAKEKGAVSINALAQPEYAKLLENKGFLLDGFFARIFLGKN